MDNKFKIGIVIIVILALIAGYLAVTPHYKTIEMSGFTFEVPESNAEVKNNTVNYNTYIDTEYDLNIKTWACNDINDMNGTINASNEMGTQLGENIGTNIMYNNITLNNKSGTYTYFESDTENSCIIIITSKKLDYIKHIIDTMNKPHIKVDSDKFNVTSSGLVIKDANNDTSNNQTTTKKTSSTKKKSGNETIYIDGDPEANGEYKGVGEGIYRDTKTGKVYTQNGRNQYVRSPHLDHYEGLAE